MNKYLLIDFNRYETENSKHYHLFANSPEAALTEHVKTYTDDEEEMGEEFDYLMETYQNVDTVFSCVSLEESDILIYKL